MPTKKRIMILSMTGFGKAEFELNSKKFTIEAKALNSKQLDINTRIPSLYKEKDIEVRKEISESLQRGKVDLSIFFENLGDESNAVINTPVVKDYFKQLLQISTDLDISANAITLQSVLRLPDSIRVEREKLDENEWAVIRQHVKNALNELVKFRTQEGKALQKDIESHITAIANLLKKIEPFERGRIDKVTERIRENLAAYEQNGSFDENRFEQELIFYMEKMDINEEKVRLVNHCNYFLDTVQQDGNAGKKLGFIAQEIGREINTIGSKANHADIQHIVVQMKDELEKIKEQLLNVL